MQGGYQVMLDHRVLQTPARHRLIVPSRALALAIAAEWEWQVRVRRGVLVERRELEFRGGEAWPAC